MPALPAGQLVDAVLSAIQDSGYAGLLLNRKIREHPRRFLITDRSEDRFEAWVYVWTLTFGGRENLPDEFRIQMTTVASPLSLNPTGPTVLVGYEPNLNLFAGFDLERHEEFTEGSPMVSTSMKAVRDALENGLSFFRKSNQEITVGIRPDRFVEYVRNASELHQLGRDMRTLGLISRATTLEHIPEEDVEVLSQNRRRLIHTVSRLSRDGSFRQQVLNAYSSRCAVTRLQLRLVDAAHILPVGVPGSVDDVRNGLALSATYHRAYDNGLIYLDQDYVMRVNPAREQALREARLDGGFEGFRAALGRILLPPDRRQWPNRSYIQRANGVRRIVL